MKILFIQAGGTIDKGYPAGDDHHGYGFEIEDPAFERVLDRINVNFEFTTQHVLRKDSIDLTDEDRQKLFQVISDSTEKHIVITHGTDTMIKTAKKLSVVEGKVLVLTGSMNPERFKDSDADFNLGFAIAAAQTLGPGIYIAMNGEVMSWDEVDFDETKNRFVRRS